MKRTHGVQEGRAFSEKVTSKQRLEQGEAVNQAIPRGRVLQALECCPQKVQGSWGRVVHEEQQDQCREESVKEEGGREDGGGKGGVSGEKAHHMWVIVRIWLLLSEQKAKGGFCAEQGHHLMCA